MGDAEYGQQVRRHLIQRQRGLASARRARLAALETVGDAKEYIAHARAVTLKAFARESCFSGERTPLNAVTVGQPTVHSGFRVENVRFEALPGNFVTANLYLPSSASATTPAPAIVQPLGHSATAKAATGYQEASQRLALAGFAVLSYDPINQGERDQYTTLLPADEPVLGSYSPGSARTSTAAHNMMGKQMELLGEFFGQCMLWDGIRAVDFLESRAEICTSILGLTGCSGGGTMSSWLWAMEPRFTMAAPNCFVTTYLHNLENENGQDNEQCPPGVLGHGLENADMLLATNAGKPLLLTGERYDYFDRRGLSEAFEDIKTVYRCLAGNEAAEKCGVFIGEHTHGFSQEDVIEIAKFFCHHAGLPPPPDSCAGPMTAVGIPMGGGQVFAPELFSADGDVATVPGFVSIPTRVAAVATQRAAERLVPSYTTLRTGLRELLGLPSGLLAGGAPSFRNVLPRSDVGAGAANRNINGHLCWEFSIGNAEIMENCPCKTMFLY